MSDEYPNLFEKQCRESDRIQDLREAYFAIGGTREYYHNALTPKETKKDEKLERAQELLNEVISSERASIAVRLAAKYTRNPEYEHYEQDDPGVLDEFEEWQPDRDMEVYHD